MPVVWVKNVHKTACIHDYGGVTHLSRGQLACYNGHEKTSVQF